MLRNVHYPVALNPDAELRAFALKSKWLVCTGEEIIPRISEKMAASYTKLRKMSHKQRITDHKKMQARITARKFH